MAPVNVGSVWRSTLPIIGSRAHNDGMARSPTAGRRDHRDRLAAVGAGAATDSGVDAELLGEFLAEAAQAIQTGRRLTERRVHRYERQGELAAHEGVALSSLVDLYLSAAWRLWREIPELTASAAVVTPAPLLDAGESMLRTADDVVAAVAAGYQRAHAERLEQSATTRREFIDDLLSGHGEPGELADRAASFGLQLTARHRVAVLHLPGQRIEESSVLIGYAAQACQALPHSPQFLTTSKDGNVVVVIEGPDDATRRGVSDVARAVSTARPELTLGVGRGRGGESGPMRSFREATQCLQLADLVDVSPEGAYADDLFAYLALWRDRDLLEELVTGVLMSLTDLRGGAGEAIDTLQVYLDNRGSATATASALHLSVRGLTYRIERIQAALSQDLHDPHQRLTVELAILAARLLDWPTHEVSAAAVH